MMAGKLKNDKVYILRIQTSFEMATNIDPNSDTTNEPSVYLGVAVVAGLYSVSVWFMSPRPLRKFLGITVYLSLLLAAQAITVLMTRYVYYRETWRTSYTSPDWAYAESAAHVLGALQLFVWSAMGLHNPWWPLGALLALPLAAFYPLLHNLDPKGVEGSVVLTLSAAIIVALMVRETYDPRGRHRLGTLIYGWCPLWLAGAVAFLVLQDSAYAVSWLRLVSLFLVFPAWYLFWIQSFEEYFKRAICVRERCFACCCCCLRKPPPLALPA